MSNTQRERSTDLPAAPRAGRWMRRVSILVAAALFVVAVVGYAIVSARATDRGGQTLVVSEGTPTWRGQQSELADRGSVTAGGVMFTASEVQCGLPGHDWQGASLHAVGQFCVVDIEVSNRSGADLRVAPGAFELSNGEGISVSADDRASAYGSGFPAGTPDDRKVPDDASARIHLVFDVPQDIEGPLEVRFTPTPRLTLSL